MANLNSLLIARKMESDLQEALARQGAAGGDLPTCLVEVADISEADLLSLLVETYGLTAASPGDLLVDPLVLKFVPRTTAQQYSICPACQRDGVLVLFVSEPLPGAVEEDLSFALGLPLEQRLALAARIEQAISRSYGVPFSSRMQVVIDRLTGQAGPFPPRNEVRSEALAQELSLPFDAHPTPFDQVLPAAPPAQIHRRDTLPGAAMGADPRIDGIQTSSRPTDARTSISQHGTLLGIPAARRDPRLDSKPGSKAPPAGSRRRGADARGTTDAHEVHARGADAREAHARGADARGADAREVHARGADARGADARGADAHEADARGGDAHEADARGSDARGSDARESDARVLGRMQVPLAPKAATVRAGHPPADFVMEATMTTAAEIELRRRRRAARPTGSMALRDWARRTLGLIEPTGRAERHRGPFTPAAAESALEEARTPDEALRVYFEFARQYFEYTALFRIHGELAEGHDAWGPGASRDKVRAIGLALDLPSVLSQARDRGLPLITTPSDEGIDAVLAEDLARSMRTEIACIPIKVRNRTLAVLYGDHGDEGVRLETIGEVIALGSLLASALERILLRRKREIWRASRAPGPIRSSARSDSGYPLPGAGAGAGAGEGERAEPTSGRPRRDSDQNLVDDGWAVLEQSNAQTPLLAEAARLLAETSMEAAREAYASTPAVSVGSSSGQPDQGELPAGWAWPTQATADPVPAGPAGFEPALLTKKDHDEGAPREQPAALPEESRVAIAIGRLWGASQEAEPLAAPAHPPPQSAGISVSSLPPVLIHADLVEAVIQGGPGAERALGEILELGEGALPSIFARFPGPLSFDRFRAAQELPRPAACGPVLRVLSALRRLALPFLAVRSADTSAEVRFWATYLLCDLHYYDSATSLWPRLFDEDPSVRKIALWGARALLESGDAGAPIRVGLAHVIESTQEAEPRRVRAIGAASDLGRLSLVPTLVRALDRAQPEVCMAAAEALRNLTGMDLGLDPRPWKKWWKTKSRSLRPND